MKPGDLFVIVLVLVLMIVSACSPPRAGSGSTHAKTQSR
jgi:hypothetical protein